MSMCFNNSIVVMLYCCNVILLFCCVVVLVYCCVDVLLYCCNVILLFSCVVVLVYSHVDDTILVIGVVRVLMNKARYPLLQILHKLSTIYIGTRYKIPIQDH